MPGRAQIEELVPHAGAMCLIDSVSAWDLERIACAALPAGAAHPLARDGVVPTIAACEYAAQAAAVHGALLDGAPAPRAGMLATITDVDLHAPHFAHAADAVQVRAQLLSRLATGCLYAFEVSEGAHAVASGRLIVAFASPVKEIA